MPSDLYICQDRRPPTPTTPRQTRNPYHHGDLRRALLDAALEIVRDRGLSALTMRAVARKTRVSHMAAYHHFKDKAALVAAVAEEGFRALRQEMLERITCFPDDARTQLRESGIAYVVFAVRNPNLFRVMFGPERAKAAAHAKLDEAAKAAFAVVLGLVEQSQQAKTIPAGNAQHIGLHAWALVHGLAMLCIDGRLGPEASEPAHAEGIAYAALGALQPLPRPSPPAAAANRRHFPHD
jgi:AcrR family transcriptional regulator